MRTILQMLLVCLVVPGRGHTGSGKTSRACPGESAQHVE